MSNRIELAQGDTAIFRIAITDADDNPLDLSTVTDFFFTIKRSRGDLDQAAIWQGTSLDGDIVVVDSTPADGLIDVTIPKTITILMRPNRPYYWDCKMLIGAQVFTVAIGTAFVDGTILITVES